LPDAGKRRPVVPRRGARKGGTEPPLPRHLQLGRWRAGRGRGTTRTGLAADYLSGRRDFRSPLRRELPGGRLSTERPQLRERRREGELAREVGPRRPIGPGD